MRMPTDAGVACGDRRGLDVAASTVRSCLLSRGVALRIAATRTFARERRRKSLAQAIQFTSTIDIVGA